MRETAPTLLTREGIVQAKILNLELSSWPSVVDPTSMNLFDCQAMVESGIFADIQRCIGQKEPGIAEHPYLDTFFNCS